MSILSSLRILVVVAGLCAVAQGKTVYVSTAGSDANDGLSWAAAKQTVQAGLNAAVAGDQVWVAAGTYVQCITLQQSVALYGGFTGSETDLSQRDWRANVTILDGNKLGSVVTGPAGATTATRIDGFTIRNGKAASAGGISCNSSSPAISNNIITGNAIYSVGGSGIYCSSCSPTITNNTINGNTVLPGSCGTGGIYCEFFSSPTIGGNTITGNTGDSGGGICCVYSSSPTISNNTISGNSASGGGGICCSGGSPTISNNTITKNTASRYGGGIYCNQDSTTITNNTIAGNSTIGSGGYGGGIYCCGSLATIANNAIVGNTVLGYGGGIYCGSSSPTIVNDTIVGNSGSSPGYGGGIYCEYSSTPKITNTIICFNSSGIYLNSSYPSTPTLRYSCVYGNGAYNYSGMADPTGTNCNISVDPQLADVASGNLHVQPTSPCVDAGDDTAVQAGWTDIDGQARVQGAHVDIGGDESDGTVWPVVAAVLYVSPSGSDNNNGLSWASAKQTMQAAINAGGSGSQVWVAAGTYVGTIQLRFGIALYGGFAGTETDLSQRNWRTNITILDGNQAGSVVTAPPAGTASTRIDGFTIRNGKASYGGGIYCSSSSPTIANNTITGNRVSSYRGGGIYCEYSSPTIINNTFSGNMANTGGGIYCTYSSPLISSNTITGHEGASGAGIYCSHSSPAITSNTITGNTASSSGGGIYCEYSSPTITGNIITGNTTWSSGYGGGIYCTSASSPKISNNTILGNAAPSGGGIYCSSPASSPTIVNTIIAFNSSGICGAPVVRYCCAYGNSVYNYSGITDPTGTNGNISVDPQLADVTRGNLHLQATSPCIDAGDDTAVQTGWTDIDGQARVQGAHVDIGADESDGTVWPSAAAILYVSSIGSDSNDGLSWASAKQTVQAAIDAGGRGTQVWVAAGTYVGTIQLRFGIALYGGFAGTETDLSQRNWRTNVTILDGNQVGSVVTVPQAATAYIRIDGFTIRNGKGSYGGGIYCLSFLPTITNNTITGNTATYYGGGINCSGSSITIANNTITGNNASATSNYANSYGGGIYCSGSSVTIANNTITGNNASAAGSQSSSSYGGGIYCSSSLVTIANNTITGNNVWSSGGYNCDSYGGGVYCSTSPTIINTIIAFNSSGIYCSSGTPTMRCGCVYGNTRYNFGNLADPTGTNGNISLDPQLAGVGRGNVHLQPGSPCIDAGDDTVVQASWTDMDGQARVQGRHVDIGADESDGTVWPAIAVYVSPSGSDSNDGTSWGSAKKTVQAGLNAALNGDQVWVAAGTYVECVTLKGGIALYGGFIGNETDLSQRNWGTNVTILDGNQAGGVVTGPAAGLAAIRIDGFTIRNGKSSSNGGGIYCPSSLATITNNTITGNATSSDGGGIYCSSSSPTITNNAITGNTASYNGGGICCSGSSATITNNAITGNTASYYGGGVYCASSSSTIANNSITGNNVSSSGEYHGSSGGGICCCSSSSTIINNAIVGNIATVSGSSGGYVSSGGGIYCNDASPIIANNTITGNAASGYRYGAGGGIYCISSSPTITNTIVAFNSSGICNGYGATPALRYCCVYGNSVYNYSGITDPTGTNGNVSADPQLADVARGNIHLQPTSPCIDAGDDSVVQAGWTDIDGQARVQGKHVDIGAEESDGTVWPAAPAVLYVSSNGSDSTDGLSWGSAKRTVQAAVDAGGTGSQIWVAAGTYIGTVQLRVGMALYGGFVGSEANLSQRDWRTNVTILDGNQTGCVVTAPLVTKGLTRIDGFTIRNGTSYGGIYCSGSYATITNNTITGNSGSGIYCESSSLMVTNNSIIGNTGSSGGGVCCSSSSATIANNTITGNTASYYNGGGGGICCSSPVTIANNTITGNTAYSGGGICCSSSATITNNTITGNTAYSGGGIYCGGSSPMIVNNTIAGNTASSPYGIADGGGIYCYSSSPTITNSTIIGNSAFWSGFSCGGGIRCIGSSPTITNTIIAFNSSGIFSNSDTYPSITTLRYCCVYANSDFNFSGLTDPTGINGNISVDPLFLRQTAPYDLHLMANSPCINAGDPSFNGSGVVDLDGKARVVGGRVDMGAYEFVLQPPTIVTNDPLIAGKVGVAYSLTFQGSGGASPYTWSISAGSVPAGLSFSSGVLSGTPITVGTTSFTVQVTGRDGATSTKDFTLAVAPPDLPGVPGNPAPADGQINIPVSSTLSWSGANTWVTFDVYLDTVNPPGKKIASGVSAVSLSPSLAGSTRYYWQVVAIDASGQTPGPVWSFATHLAGDINGDGFVNVGDLQRLVAAWGSDNSGGWGNWNANADLNNDGYVNVSDLQILVASWGTALR